MQRMLCSTGITTPFEFEREVAYSRESNHPKQYVQNLLTRDAAKIYDYWIRFTTFQHLLSAIFIIFLFIRKGGYVYICGKISMAEGVEYALKDVLRHIGMMEPEAVESTFLDMRRNLRYQEDIFG